MSESEKPKPSGSAVPASEPTPFDKFKALASALVNVPNAELEAKIKAAKTAAASHHAKAKTPHAK